tara:strand:- start:253 stop:1347 length:1095 start_codon:yes stop_codon:yes gene_type:complete
MLLFNVGVVLAQSDGSIFNRLGTGLENFAESKFAKFVLGGGFIENIMMMRILFATLIAVMLYGISSLLMGGMTPGIRVSISIIVGIISSAVLPSTMLVAVAGLWGGSIVAIFMLTPVLGGLWLIFNTFKEPSRLNYIFKAVISAFMYTLSSNAEKALVGTDSEVIAAAQLLYDIFGWLALAFAIMTFWYAIRSFTAGGEGTTAQLGLEGAANQMEGLKKGWSRMKSTFGKAYSYEMRIVKDLEAAKDDIEGGAMEDAKQKLQDAHQTASNMLAIEKIISKLEKKIENAEKGSVKLTALKNDVKRYANMLRGSVGGMWKDIEMIVDDKAGDSDAILKKMDDIIELGKIAEGAILELEKLDKKLLK